MLNDSQLKKNLMMNGGQGGFILHVVGTTKWNSFNDCDKEHQSISSNQCIAKI